MPTHTGAQKKKLHFKEELPRNSCYNVIRKFPDILRTCVTFPIPLLTHEAIQIFRLSVIS